MLRRDLMTDRGRLQNPYAVLLCTADVGPRAYYLPTTTYLGDVVVPRNNVHR